jgi:hypothetical protein
MTMKPFAHSFAIVALVAFVACGSSTDPSTVDASTVSKTYLASVVAGDLTVALLTDSQLQTGLTPVYLKISTATGVPVTDAAVAFMPMMAMSTGVSHTCPMLGAPTVGADGLYRVDVVFSMPSTAVDSWSATATITRPAAAAVQAVFPLLTVMDSGRLKTFTYTDPVSATTTKYITSLSFVGAPKVGLNPIVFTLHFRQDMMTFPSVDDAVLLLDPEMPSMGHGSPGSINPTLTAPGRYEGQLSFSMAGEWETTVTVNRAGVTVGAPVFATVF